MAVIPRLNDYILAPGKIMVKGMAPCSPSQDAFATEGGLAWLTVDWVAGVDRPLYLFDT